MATSREIAALSIMIFAFLVISCFVFEGRIWVLIAPVPGQCLLVAFIGNH